MSEPPLTRQGVARIGAPQRDKKRGWLTRAVLPTRGAGGHK